jgi:hypothetical protein
MTFAMPIRECQSFHKPLDFADRDRIVIALRGHNPLKNGRQRKLSFSNAAASGTTPLSINNPQARRSP